MKRTGPVHFKYRLLTAVRATDCVQTMGDTSYSKVFNKPFQIQAIMKKSFCFGPVNFLS